MSKRKDLQWLRFSVEGAVMFSTCGKRQFFAFVLDEYGHVLGTGYNGGPKGVKHCVDGGCPRFQENSPAGSNYDNCIASHAEQNALLHSDYSARVGGTIVVNGSPCFTCAKLIANSGLSRVVCRSGEGHSYDGWGEVKAKLRFWGVAVDEYEFETEEDGE